MNTSHYPVLKKSFLLKFRYADLAGIMFFGNLLPLCQDLLEDFVLAQGISWSDWFQNPDLAAPIRFAECDFRRPLEPGHEIAALVRITENSISSISFQIDFEQQNSLCAIAKLVVVCVNPKTRQKCPTPQFVRERFRLK